MKAIIFDASTLISLSMNGLLDVLRKLKQNFNGKFLITADVKREAIDKPLTIKRFSLEARNVQALMDEKVLEMPNSVGVKDSDISKNTQELEDIANRTFFSSKKDIHLVDSGEVSCLVLSRLLEQKKVQSVIAVDERTTRVLCEKPQNLLKLFEKKLHTKIEMKKENLKHFQGFKFIRSAEIVYVAYKKGLTRLKGKEALDSLLYALRFKGCSISSKEIDEMKALG